MTRNLRALLAVLLGAVGAIIFAATASAHTSATAEPATAGAPNAVLSFYAAAESETAGITSLKIVLPDGLPAADVIYLDGPAGWALQPAADGYTVTGPAAPVGRDVQHRVRVKALPLVPALVFKVLQTYTDGRVDRWIEVPTAANAEPENPAPVVQLAAPAGGFPGGAGSNAPTPASTDHAEDSPPPSTASTKDDSGSPLPWILAAVVLVAVVAGGAVLVRRRLRGDRGL